MDRDVTLYQITNVMAERVFQKIDNFNKGRREDAGYYAISVSNIIQQFFAISVTFDGNKKIPIIFITVKVGSFRAKSGHAKHIQN